MKELLMYVSGVVVCSALFTLFYRIVLQGRTSFRTARMFLLFSLVAATVIPAFDIPVWRSTPIELPPFEMELPAIATAIPDPQPQTDWLPVALWTLYGAGMATLGAIMICQAARIARMGRRAKIYRMEGCRIAVSEEVIAPFSFLATVYVGRGTPADEIRRIVLHESSHIRHRHSIEKIAMETLKTLLWFDPFAWWASRLLTEVHEFEADRDVLDGGCTIEEYLPVIFRQIFGYIPEISVGLGNSLTKKRFLMMKTRMKHTKYSWLRAAGVLPIAAGTLALFGFTHRAPEIITSPAPTVAEVELLTQSEAAVPQEPDGKPLIIVDGERVASLDGKIDPNTIKSIDVLKEASSVAIYGEEGRNGAIIVTRWKEGEIREGKLSVGTDEDATRMTFYPNGSVTLRADKSTTTDRDGEVKVIGYGMQRKSGAWVTGSSDAGVVIQGNGKLTNTFIWLSREEKQLSDGEMQNIAPENIRSVDVLKGESVDKLPDGKLKAAIAGRDYEGIIIITTK